MPFAKTLQKVKMANDLTRVLDMISEDILKVMKKGEILTQYEIYKRRTLTNYHENGWSYALERLEKKHLVEFIDPEYWRLKDPSRITYLHNVQELLDTKLSPDDFNYPGITPLTIQLQR